MSTVNNPVFSTDVETSPDGFYVVLNVNDKPFLRILPMVAHEVAAMLTNAAASANASAVLLAAFNETVADRIPGELARALSDRLQEGLTLRAHEE